MPARRKKTRIQTKELANSMRKARSHVEKQARRRKNMRRKKRRAHQTG